MRMRDMSIRKDLAALFCVALFAQGCVTASRSSPTGLAGLPPSIEQLAHDAQGRVGAAACVLETGETVVVAGDERFPMQSVYKMPIAMAVLHEVDTHRLSIDQVIEVGKEQLAPESLYSPIRTKFPRGTKLTIRELIGYAVSESDNVASDLLMDLAGGPAQVTSYLRGLGIDDVTVATTERQMDADASTQYRSWATPRGALKLLSIFHAGAGLSAQSQAVLREAMVQTATGPRRIKGMLPPGTVVAHKTGTSGTAAGRTAATNDIGIITLPDGRHLAVVVFISDSIANTEARESTIARIARAAYDQVSPQ